MEIEGKQRRTTARPAPSAPRESFYRRLFESASDSILLVSAEGHIVEANEAALRTYGYLRQEFLGLDVREIVAPEQRSSVPERLRLLLETPRRTRRRHRHSDGGILDVEILARPVMVEGKPHILASVRDITLQKAAEEALRRSERQLRIRNQIADAFLRATDEGVYRELLPVLLEALDSPHGIIGHLDESGVLVCHAGTRDEMKRLRLPPEEIRFPPEDWTGLWGRALKERTAQCSNEPQEVPEGHPPIRRAVAVPIVQQGEVVGLVMVGNKRGRYEPEDVTLLQAIAGYTAPVLHARLQRDSRERERVEAMERRARLEVQLRKAQKLETIGTLAGGIAHDFNNILTPIFGYVEMALRKLPPESGVRDSLEHVILAADRARELVEQILAFSRQVEQERRPLRIHLIVREALKLLGASLPSTITIRERVDPEAGLVLADATQIHQVVLNLCTNAYHAMREEGGVLEVDLRALEESDPVIEARSDPGAGRYVLLAISDTGHGMDRETRDRVFDPFFTTKAAGEGTGLGLAVVHEIVGRHGGEIQVESEPGRGTRVRVLLPRIEDEPHREALPAEALPEGHERILIVDDEEEIAVLGKEMLEGLGYEVTVSTSSLEALETFRGDPAGFDLVVTDQTMPGLTGQELARRLLELRPGLPVILVTGFSERIVEEEVRALGVRELASKPLAFRDLGRTIRRVLDQEVSEPPGGSR
jgi:PAS domain S-box-containing protein